MHGSEPVQLQKMFPSKEPKQSSEILRVENDKVRGASEGWQMSESTKQKGGQHGLLTATTSTWRYRKLCMMHLDTEHSL
eukprot:4443043-Amphidinium_carterae.2